MSLVSQGQVTMNEGNTIVFKEIICYYMDEHRNAQKNLIFLMQSNTLKMMMYRFCGRLLKKSKQVYRRKQNSYLPYLFKAREKRLVIM
jgi:hypothetical protein